MRGSPKYQAHSLYTGSGVNRIGHSKHVDKQEARMELEAQGKSVDWHELGQRMGIYSYATADAYRDVWADALAYARSEYGIRDIEKLTGQAVQGYLESKVADGVAYSTFQQYAAAAEKLSVALNRYSERQGTGNRYDFHTVLATVRETARELLVRFDGTRAYERPGELVSAVGKPDHHLAASLQYESGSRVYEISEIRENALHGVASDIFTREEKGYFAMQGKGGKEGMKAVSVTTFERLRDHIREHGLFKVNQNSYRESLRKAAAKTDQRYEGSHGLRWNWAQERYAELQDRGLDEVRTMFEVSQEMGHERADITMHYLRGE